METKICKECGKEMHPYFYTGMYYNPHKRTFCSRKCQCRNHAREYIKKHPATKKKKSEYDARYRKENHAKRTEQCRKWYVLNKNREDIKKRQREYAIKHRSILNINSRIYEKKHPEKIREIKLLRSLFGTAKLSIEVKKKWAMVHIGNRLTLNGCKGKVPFNLNENEMKNLFINISEGRTYEAYI